MIEGGGGDDQLFGGADGDFLDGGAGANSIDGGTGADNCVNPGGGAGCDGTAPAVAPRDPGKVSVGLMTPPGSARSQLYVTGSARQRHRHRELRPRRPSPSRSRAAPASTRPFRVAARLRPPRAARSGPLDSVVLAGLGGNDTLSADGFPQETGVTLLGGARGRHADRRRSHRRPARRRTRRRKGHALGLGRDDALLHQGGPDELLGGEGNDLFLSTSICDGETLNGGEGRDNSSWARLAGGGVDARLDLGAVGRFGAPGEPGCGGSGTPDSMTGIEDLEGSESADELVGDAGENQLLGHKGPDEYFAGAGADTILANSADSDPVIDCGADFDQAVIDIPTATYADATPIECESVREAAPEDFRTADRTAATAAAARYRRPTASRRERRSPSAPPDC